MNLFLDPNNRLRTGWKLLTFGALVVVSIGIGLTTGILSSVALELPAERGDAVMQITMAVALVASSWLCLALLEKKKLPAIGLGHGIPGIAMFTTGLVSGAILIGLYLALVLLTGHASFDLTNGPVDWSKLLAITIFWFGLSAVEELLFRGYAFQILARWHRPTGVLLTGVAFASYHWFNEGGLSIMPNVSLFLLHLLLVACLLKTGSLYLIIGIHAGWNIAQGPLLGLNVSGAPAEASILAVTVKAGWWSAHPQFGPEDGLAAALVILAALVAVGVALSAGRKSRELHANQPPSGSRLDES